MKHFIIIALLFLSLGVTAQTTRSAAFKSVTPSGTVKTVDTTTDTDTSYLWNGRTDHNQWANVSLQFVNTQITGTVTVTMIVQGSNDATTAINGNWYTLKTSTVQQTTTSDTGTANATQYLFNLPNCNYKYLRVRKITGGTGTSSMTGTYWLASPYRTLLN
jgi:hypothetical protein